MKDVLSRPLTEREQQRVMERLYLLLGKQVERYHSSRHMGKNSSIPVELARDLMDSMVFTFQQAGGIGPDSDMEALMKQGQKILEAKRKRGVQLLQLVVATAPRWQTECRCEAVSCLERYLDGYDLEHLAHKGPAELFYPITIALPDELQGMDQCLFYLQVMWRENQIMAAFSEEALSALWDRLHRDAEDACEQVICNAIAKVMLCGKAEDLVFREQERAQFQKIAAVPLREQWMNAARRLWTDELWLQMAAAPLPRLEAALEYGNLEMVLL